MMQQEVVLQVNPDFREDAKPVDVVAPSGVLKVKVEIAGLAEVEREEAESLAQWISEGIKLALVCEYGREADNIGLEMKLDFLEDQDGRLPEG